MSKRHDELEARRWFRQRLHEIAAAHPELTTPQAQKRLAAHVETMTGKESAPCPDSPPADRPDAP